MADYFGGTGDEEKRLNRREGKKGNKNKNNSTSMGSMKKFYGRKKRSIGKPSGTISMVKLK